LYPLWDVDAGRFVDIPEGELTRRACSVRADEGFMEALTRAAASAEPVNTPSKHVELQIYRGDFFSDADVELCRQFHAAPWDAKLEMIGRFGDQRLKRLARRLIYLESPHLFDEAERRVIARDIAERRRGEGKHADPPWTTLTQALSELESIGVEASDAFREAFLALS
jgi:exodeoxyribonuclease-1